MKRIRNAFCWKNCIQDYKLNSRCYHGSGYFCIEKQNQTIVQAQKESFDKMTRKVRKGENKQKRKELLAGYDDDLMDAGISFKKYYKEQRMMEKELIREKMKMERRKQGDRLKMYEDVMQKAETFGKESIERNLDSKASRKKRFKESQVSRRELLVLKALTATLEKDNKNPMMKNVEIVDVECTDLNFRNFKVMWDYKIPNHPTNIDRRHQNLILQRASGFLGGRIAFRGHLRFAPRLIFHYRSYERQHFISQVQNKFQKIGFLLNSWDKEADLLDQWNQSFPSENVTLESAPETLYRSRKKIEKKRRSKKVNRHEF